jgi:hypothetical protein
MYSAEAVHSGMDSSSAFSIGPRTFTRVVTVADYFAWGELEECYLMLSLRSGNTKEQIPCGRSKRSSHRGIVCL